jgi:hypothetical protein
MISSSKGHRTHHERAIIAHQILSQRRFFVQFVGTEEAPVEELLPPGDQPPVQAHLDKYVTLARGDYRSLLKQPPNGG